MPDEPLTLLCQCPEDIRCVLSKLTFNWNAYIGAASRHAELFAFGNLIGPETIPFGGGIVGDEDHPVAAGGAIDLDIDQWVPHWNDAIIQFKIDGALFQPFSMIVFAGFSVDEFYTCIRSNGDHYQVHITAQPRASDSCECRVPDPSPPYGTVLRSAQQIGGSLFNAFFAATTPLGICNGCTVEGGDFSDNPVGQVVEDSGDTEAQCLCVQGGAGNNRFQVAAGDLPSGQDLDETSGCVTGAKDLVSAGSPEVTFRVIDGEGNSAEVTCNYNRGCAPPPSFIPNVVR